MKILTFLLTTLIALGAYADSTSNDFSKHSGEVKNFTAEELRKRLEIRGSLYVLNPTGDILLFQGQEMRKWQFSSSGDLTSHWSFSSDQIKEIALKNRWTMDGQGRLRVHIQQYDKITANNRGDRKPKLGKLLKEKKFIVKNFEPITWEVRSTPKQKVVVRLTPVIRHKQQPEQVGKLPISAKNMMMADNKGHVWTSDATFSGEYIALKTNRGTVYMSYQPFKGSKEIGFAKENKIRIDVNKKHYLRLLSTAPFVPFGIQAKVYGKINLKQKTQVGSTHVQASSEEKEFLSVVK